MPDWLILLVIGFVVWRVRSRSRRWRGRRLRVQPRGELQRSDARSIDAEPASPVLATENPVESLQRRFVQGSITVEQYEEELDRVLRRPPS